MFATKSFHKGPDRLENELFSADIDQVQLLIHQVAPPGDPVQTGVGWRHATSCWSNCTLNF